MSDYRNVALTEDAKWKLELWQEHLSLKWGHQATASATVEYLLDSAGIPPEEDDGD